MHSFTDTPLKNVHTLKQMHFQTKNAYKNFHDFTCTSVIKTYATGLVLKSKTAILHSYS